MSDCSASPIAIFNPLMSGAAKFTLIVIPLHGYRTTHQGAGTKNRRHHGLPELLPAQNEHWVLLLGSRPMDETAPTSQRDPKYGIIKPHKCEGFGGDKS